MTTILDFNNALTQRELETYLNRDRAPADEGRVDRIRSGLSACADSFVAWLFPAAIFSRRRAHVGNVHGDPGSSLVIELTGSKAGLWKDWADPSEKGGDLIALYQAARSRNFGVALEELAEWLGQGTRPEIQYERQRLLSRVKRVDRDLGPTKGEWHYTDADGVIVATVYRYEPEGGGKEYLPWDAVRGRYGNPDVRPLYNIPGILQAQTVVLCEGEKAAQALIDRGICATSVMGGSSSPLEQTDMSPLQGKRVVIWPDADEPGRKFGAAVALALKDVASEVEAITPPEGVAEGWDAADAADEGRDIASLLGSPARPDPVLPFFWFGDASAALDANDFVEGLLTTAGMSVIYGPSNCGKTFFSLDLALHVALGRPWRGKQVDRGAVVYLSLEGAQGIRNRIAAFRAHHELDGEVVPFVVMPRPINLLDSQADTNAVIQLVEHVAQETGLPVRMVVVDTLSRAMAGGNENSSEDMTALIGNCDTIRSRTGAHVSIIHHSGKDEAKGARGHSSLRAATDTEIEIRREPEAKVSNVRIAKQRDLEAGDPFAFSLLPIELGTNARGKAVTSCVVGEADADDLAPTDEAGLSPKQEQAFNCLINVLDMIGEVHEGGAPLSAPIGTKVVALEHWKTRLRSTGVLDRTQDNLARSQFSKLRKALEKKGKIECWNGAVWLSAP